MNERPRDASGVGAGEQRDAERAPGPDLVRFRALAVKDPNATPEERAAIAASLIDLIIAMRAPGNDREESRAVLQQLELKSLGSFSDAKGRNARKEAVETLMVMGFPYALAISPEDFAFARRYVAEPAFDPDAFDDNPRWKQQMRTSRRICSGLVIAGNAAQTVGMVSLMAQGHGAGMLGLISALGSIGLALWFLTLPADPDYQSLPLTGLGMLGVLNVFALIAASSSLPAIGLFANALGIAAAILWQNDEPGRRI